MAGIALYNTFDTQERSSNMNIKISAHTTPNNQISQEEIKVFSGQNAGVCYMPDNWDALTSEEKEKTLNLY